MINAELRKHSRWEIEFDCIWTKKGYAGS
jgi:hypothetical protein